MARSLREEDSPWCWSCQLRYELKPRDCENREHSPEGGKVTGCPRCEFTRNDYTTPCGLCGGTGLVPVRVATPDEWRACNEEWAA